MWGNQLGWIIAGIIAICMGALLTFAMIPPGITSPTGKLTLAMKTADLSTDPNTIIPAPTGDTDAGPIYRKVGDEWSAHHDQYEGMKNALTATSKNVPGIVNDLLTASDAGRMTLFTNHLDDEIGYQNDHPTLDGLFAAGQLLNSLGLLHTTKDYADLPLASRYATAAFNLGRHLYQERIVYLEWMAGLNLMSDAAGVLSLSEQDPSKADLYKQFSVAINEFIRGQATPLWAVIGGISEEDKAKYAGDFFQIARESPERMWRVESILKLGKFKFNAATKGDQIGAKRVLRQMAAASPSTYSSDPLTQTSVHAAALAAANLTIEDYRLIK